MATVEAIYYGKAEAMTAEIGTPAAPSTISARNARYVVQPIGDAEWDAEWFATLADARTHAWDLAVEVYQCGDGRLFLVS